MLIEKNKIYITKLLSPHIVEDKTAGAKKYPFSSKLLNSKHENLKFSHTIHGIYDIDFKTNLDLIFEINTSMINTHKITDLFNLCFEINGGKKNALLSEKGQEIIIISASSNSFCSSLILGRQCIIHGINIYITGNKLHQKLNRLYNLIK